MLTEAAAAGYPTLFPQWAWEAATDPATWDPDPAGATPGGDPAAQKAAVEARAVAGWPVPSGTAVSNRFLSALRVWDWAVTGRIPVPGRGELDAGLRYAGPPPGPSSRTGLLAAHLSVAVGDLGDGGMDHLSTDRWGDAVATELMVGWVSRHPGVPSRWSALWCLVGGTPPEGLRLDDTTVMVPDPRSPGGPRELRTLPTSDPRVLVRLWRVVRGVLGPEPAPGPGTGQWSTAEEIWWDRVIHWCHQVADIDTGARRQLAELGITPPDRFDRVRSLFGDEPPDRYDTWLVWDVMPVTSRRAVLRRLTTARDRAEVLLAVERDWIRTLDALVRTGP